MWLNCLVKLFTTFNLESQNFHLLTGHKISALAVDFDEDQLQLPESFVASVKQYGISAYIERSKSKGYHAWIFFEQGGVSARKARLVAHKILADLGKPKTEVFPKQDALTSEVSYGNFINAPLFGALVPKGRTVFVDPADPTGRILISGTCWLGYSELRSQHWMLLSQTVSCQSKLQPLNDQNAKKAPGQTPALHHMDWRLVFAKCWHRV
jgi:hypothetical protein